LTSIRFGFRGPAGRRPARFGASVAPHPSTDTSGWTVATGRPRRASGVIAPVNGSSGEAT
jgi:hypothetical protein